MFLKRGGVNTSEVFGDITDEMKTQLKSSPLGDRGVKWFACGLSLVIHPINPFVPTVHCNYRMFELYDKQDKLMDRWFGGGTDLTPYYLFEEDAVHFHQTYKKACDDFDIKLLSVFIKRFTGTANVCGVMPGGKVAMVSTTVAPPFTE